MKTPYQNIYQVLRLNRFIVLAVVLGSTAACIVSCVITFKMYNQSINGAFALTDQGEVLPLKWMEASEGLEVEALDHLHLFHTYFYGIDASSFEANIEKALWLGNASVDNVYRQKKADGVYNRLLQYGLVQKVLKIDSEVHLNTVPFTFRTVTQFEVNRGSVTDTYELVTSGSLTQLEKRNFPKNTHGLLITNYFENSLKKLDNENR